PRPSTHPRRTSSPSPTSSPAASRATPSTSRTEVRMRKLLGAAGWLTAGVGIGVGALAGFTAWTLNGPRRPWPNYTFTPFELDVPFDDIEFTAPDGVPLAGWRLDRPDSPIVVICTHGHRGNKSD